MIELTELMKYVYIEDGIEKVVLGKTGKGSALQMHYSGFPEDIVLRVDVLVMQGQILDHFHFIRL